MKGTIRLLGTGASAGVPVVGCACSVCRSPNLKNKRLRTSAFIRVGKAQFLVDCSPDFRQQALQYGCQSPQALFITHPHFDHIGGFEELRAYTLQRGHSIRCYLSESSFESIQRLYYYHFIPRGENESFKVQYDFVVLKGDRGEIIEGGVPISYFTYYQGGMPVTGFRFGSLAYITDIKTFDESLFGELKDLECLLLSALRRSDSRMQLTIDEAIAFSQRVGARQTYFIHIAHEIDHDEESRRLPSSIHLAYDGLELAFHVGTDTHTT